MIVTIRICSILLFILLMAFVANPVLGRSSGEWIKDTKTNCKVWNQHPKLGKSVKWHGKCLNGWASGYGTLEWYEDGVIIYTHVFKDGTGAMLQEGKIVSRIHPSSIKLKVQECRKRSQKEDYYQSYRVIQADVTEQVDLAHRPVVDSILSLVEQFAWEKCPAKTAFGRADALSNVVAKLYQKGELVVRARSYASPIDGTGDPSWREYSNNIIKRQRAAANSRIRAEQDRRREEAKKAASEERQRKILAKQEKEKREKEEAIKRFNAFSKKNDVDAWPLVKELSTNPFVYEDQVVAIVLNFSKMLTATKGLFGDDVVVSKIPKGLFRSEARVLIAGKVLRKTAIKTPFGGEVMLPHLKYLDVYFCKKWDCTDIIAR